MLSDDDDITLIDDLSSCDELYDQLDQLCHSDDDWHQRQIEDDEARAAYDQAEQERLDRRDETRKRFKHRAEVTVEIEGDNRALAYFLIRMMLIVTLLLLSAVVIFPAEMFALEKSLFTPSTHENAMRFLFDTFN